MFCYFFIYISKVKKLQRACLKNPVRVEVSKKHETVDELDQYSLLVPLEYKVSMYIILIILLMQLIKFKETFNNLF